MDFDHKIPRKKFFNLLGITAVAGLGVLWARLSATNEKLTAGSSELKIPGSVNDGITITEGIILVKKGRTVRAYSAVCTHAGCSITGFEGAILKCPCHGSEYDSATGKPLKGPSVKPLKQLRCRFEPITGSWFVSRG